MNTLTNHIVARCIRPAAEYIENAASIEGGILPTSGPHIEFDETFDPGEPWRHAVRSLYGALDRGLALIVTDERGHPEDVKWADVEPWAEAWLDDDERHQGEWARRIVNVMMSLQRINGVSDLGDYEFNLILQVIRNTEE